MDNPPDHQTLCHSLQLIVLHMGLMTSSWTRTFRPDNDGKQKLPALKDNERREFQLAVKVNCQT